MRALITGINGMDGSHLADLLLEKGYQVFGMERRCSSPNRTNTKHLEDKIGIKAQKEYLKMQDGDVVDTWASTKNLKDWIDYKPKTSVKDGISSLVEWYKKYYKL